jgi:hypothetical protein
MMRHHNLVLLLLLMGLSIVTNAQNFSEIMKSDTLYFLDGRSKLAVNLQQGNDNEEYFSFIERGKAEYETKQIMVPKRDVHYLYSNSEYSLINAKTVETEQERLRKNLMLYNKQRNAGLAISLSGVGMLVGSMVVSEIQLSQIKKNQAVKSTTVNKFMNYGGYGMMLIGTIIQMDAGHFIHRSKVDITPVGVRLHIGIQ